MKYYVVKTDAGKILEARTSVGAKRRSGKGRGQRRKWDRGQRPSDLVQYKYIYRLYQENDLIGKVNR